MTKKLIAPNNSDELREMLTDRTTMAELLKDGDKFAEFIEAGIQNRIKHDPEILAQVSEQAELKRLDFLRANQGFTDEIAKRLNLDNPNARGRIKPNTVYNAQAIGAPFDDAFASMPQFIHSISQQAFRDSALSEKLSTLKNELSTVKPSDGGFLIPEILRAELLRVAVERSVVRSRARVIPMENLKLAFPTVDSTSNVSSIYGGITGYWTEEGATLTESQPRFGRIELEAHKLTLYTEVPNELLADARPALAAFLNDIFPEALAWFEDIAFAIGGGVGEPLGYMNAPATIALTREASGNDIEWVDIANMYSRMLPQSLDRAVWVVSPDSLPDLLTMQLPGGAAPVIIGGGQYATGSARPVMSMLGAPIIVSEKAKQLGNQGDINFVDFGFYLIGDRQAMSARQSEEFRFDSDKTAFRVIERLDGQPWLRSAITPQNGGPTLSPFVTLADA